jgi:hypothetical protein
VEIFKGRLPGTAGPLKRQARGRTKNGATETGVKKWNKKTAIGGFHSC